MIVQTAPFPSLGYDCVTVMTPTRAAALKAAGMSFAVRYLGGINQAELAAILNAGLLFMPVTFSRAPGWVPTAAMGTSDGQQDVAQLQALGLPQGCTVWIDLEGVDPSTPASAVSDWVNARSAVIKGAGFDAGLYVGYSCILDGAQLYALPNINRYWCAFNGTIEPSCGFCMRQLNKTITLAGTEIDVDCIQYDFKDRLPNMVAAG